MIGRRRRRVLNKVTSLKKGEKKIAFVVYFISYGEHRKFPKRLYFL